MAETKVSATLKYGRLLNDTFFSTYIILFGYTAITLIEALRTPLTSARHIMNIETAVSMVAGIVYGTFLDKINKNELKLDEVMPLRYMDWMVTTPLILLAIVLFYRSGGARLPYECFTIIAVLNWLMLGAGYLGERGMIPFHVGLGLGFLFFILMLAFMFTVVIPNGTPIAVFTIFAVIWTCYGIAYTFEEEEKNISYNILDVVSKALFGVVLWLYYGKVLAF